MTKVYKTTDWRHASRGSQVNKRSLSLALANIEKMDSASLMELQVAIQNMSNKSSFKPDIIALTETWEDKLEKIDHLLEGYSFISNPIERRKGATRGTGGTGFWVADAIANQCSKVTPEVTHPDILWTQFVSGKHTTYVAVIYSRPKDLTNHQLLMMTLEKNREQYAAAGKVVIMGDFNSRIAYELEEPRKHGPYERAMVGMLKVTGMEPLKASKAVVNRNGHWTFVGRAAGRSIIDYILVDNQDRGQCTYAVHPEINLQGQHRLLSCTLPYERTEDGFEWGIAERTTFDWSDEGVLAYKTKLENEYPASSLATLMAKSAKQTKEDA